MTRLRFFTCKDAGEFGLKKSVHSRIPSVVGYGAQGISPGGNGTLTCDHKKLARPDGQDGHRRGPVSPSLVIAVATDSTVRSAAQHSLRRLQSIATHGVAAHTPCAQRLADLAPINVQ